MSRMRCGAMNAATDERAEWPNDNPDDERVKTLESDNPNFRSHQVISHFDTTLYQCHAYNYPLTDNDLLLLVVERVLWDFQVKRSGTTADTAGNVVVGTVAGAEPSTVVTRLADRDTTQVSAVVGD